MDLIQALTDEWTTLRQARRTSYRFRHWQEGDGRLRRWSSLDDLISFAQRRGDPAASDRALSHLAKRSPHDDLAARALLQALLPGIRSVVASHYWLADREDLVASAIALAWERIRTYPYDRRPQRIAANVLHDTAHRLRHSYPPDSHRSAREREEPLVNEPGHEAIELLDLAHRSLDDAGLTIVVRTRLRGEAVAAIAKEMGCSAPAVRERRRRAEVKLRSAVVATMDTHHRHPRGFTASG